jgi:hypothetical protein
MLKNKNFLQLTTPPEGKERQLQLIRDILDGGTFLPKTLTYEDIDSAFSEWADKQLRIVGEEGRVFPTISAMCEFWKIAVNTYRARVKYLGWSKERALTAQKDQRYARNRKKS